MSLRRKKFAHLMSVIKEKKNQPTGPGKQRVGGDVGLYRWVRRERGARHHREPAWRPADAEGGRDLDPETYQVVNAP